MADFTSVTPPRLERLEFSAIQAWPQDDLTSALAAFQRSAAVMLAQSAETLRRPALAGNLVEWKMACEQAAKAADARTFFESHFVPFAVTDSDRPEGLFTGYFEPEVLGTRQASPDYPVPVYRKPPDLVAFSAVEESSIGLRYGRRIDGLPQPYLLRRDIENGALARQGLEICWLKSWVDAFFMHIQGSGRVILKEGGVIRLSYAAKSGHPYTGIGGVLADRGFMTRQTMSMQTVKTWMAENPDAARELMWLNKSYIFFRETAIEDKNLGGIGAAKVNLTPLRSLAVDRTIWGFGTPMWIDTAYPKEARPKTEIINHLMIAQDTGSAIKGAVRGDFYWGWGDDAALVAGHMKSPGRMTVLLPKPLAARLV